jgi:hypothetical protein
MGELFQLKRLWCKLMGDRIAVISSPYRIKDAVLYVSVHDAMWIAELPYIKADMLAKLAEAGLALVDIKFTLSKVPPPKVALAPAKRAIPAEQQLWAERVSKMITDEAIRESYLKAVLASLERG